MTTQSFRYAAPGSVHNIESATTTDNLKCLCRSQTTRLECASTRGIGRVQTIDIERNVNWTFGANCSRCTEV